MNRLPTLALLVVLALPAALGAQAPQAPQANTFAVTNARIFDGERTIPKGTVVVRDGRIEAVGADVKVPAGVEALNAGGGTLLPGMIDAHTHLIMGWGPDRALTFGVTTELDMFTVPDVAKVLREQQAAPGGVASRADILSAGYLATAPGGHGTQYGLPVPTLTRPEEAQAWVDARLAEGSDYIKIVLEDGSAYGRSRPTLDIATVAAIVKAAHARGKLAVVHVSTAANARQAIEAGADGLVHLFSDREADAGFAKLALERKAFIVPTLTVLEASNGIASGQALAEDTRVRGYLLEGEVDNLNRSFPAKTAGGMPAAFATIRGLAAAGVPILTGTDAPNPGTAHGSSIHRELELLVKAGLTPGQALTAATSAPARAFRLTDRGRIAPGLRADMVLVGGDPLKDITETRNIVKVWKGGVVFERPLAPVPAVPPVPPAKK